MHCKACDCLLLDHEAVRKSKVTGEYMDMCDKCLGYIIDDVDWYDGEPLMIELENYFEDPDDDDPEPIES